MSRRVIARMIALTLAVAAALMVGGAPSADARCVTAGADSISHTQCGLP